MKLDLVGENWMEKIGCSVCPFDFIKWHDRKDFMFYNFLIKFEEHCRETINTMTANGPITGLWFSLYIVVSSIFTFTYIKRLNILFLSSGVLGRLTVQIYHLCTIPSSSAQQPVHCILLLLLLWLGLSLRFSYGHFFPIKHNCFSSIGFSL